MKDIIDQDICARCIHLEPTKPIPQSGVWNMDCDCSEDWPYTKVFASANAIVECPQFKARA